ncbi:protein shisa-like-2A isoform X2 [Anarrhichthys ocellatus]|uniref:protein shisa-like-2A isoform X2 n=1 Tax=Anarrhichthys ocellatus TaxID=433405 RepID=UPI0012EE8E34|nr:protein shisa-like-2A isoform X2 [Anarrhichthys ocellatus]
MRATCATVADMSSDCESYYGKENVFVEGFTCPKADSDTTALFCCGFNDLKYCCDDPNSFFPYEYGYMWWLSFGALVGLSVAAVVLLAFIVTLCVLCYLFITTKPRGLDNGLPLRAPDGRYLFRWPSRLVLFAALHRVHKDQDRAIPAPPPVLKASRNTS